MNQYNSISFHNTKLKLPLEILVHYLIVILLPISEGKLKMVIQGLDEASLNEEDTQKDRRATIVNYFTGHLNTHTTYIARFVFCEFLNLVNIVGQVGNTGAHLGRKNERRI